MRDCRRTVVVSAAGMFCACWVGLSASATAAAPSFQVLGDLPGGVVESKATGVSGDGSTVVGVGRTSSRHSAFRWTQAGGLQDLGGLTDGTNTFDSRATAVSFDGSIAVGTSELSGNGPTTGVGWNLGGGPAGPVALPYPAGANALDVLAVTSDGQTVVGYAYLSGQRAYRWSPSGNGTIPIAGAIFAAGISGDGSVIAGSTGTRAFVATASAVHLIDPPDTAVAGALAVSLDGTTAVGSYDFPWPGPPAQRERQPFRWTEATGAQSLGAMPPGGWTYAVAAAVSGDGSVIVGSLSQPVGSTTPTAEAMIWDATHGMRSLQSVLELDYGIDLGEWHLGAATGVSADGKTIVGYATDGTGTQAFIAVVPEPAALGVLGGAGAMILMQRRRARV